MRGSIAILTTIAMLLGGSAHGIVRLTEESYETKTTSVIVSAKDTKKIKDAVGNYSLSLRCEIGVVRTATKNARITAAKKAKDLCAIAKGFANVSDVSFGTVTTTRSQSNKTRLIVTSKDVPNDYPYFTGGFSVLQSIGFGRWIVDVKRPETNGKITRERSYWCKNSLSNLANVSSNPWVWCVMIRMPHSVTESDINGWIRTVVTLETASGRTEAINEFQLKLP